VANEKREERNGSYLRPETKPVQEGRKKRKTSRNLNTPANRKKKKWDPDENRTVTYVHGNEER